jgi:hypothetical protein
MPRNYLHSNNNSKRCWRLAFILLQQGHLARVGHILWPHRHRVHRVQPWVRRKRAALRDRPPVPILTSHPAHSVIH